MVSGCDSARGLQLGAVAAPGLASSIHPWLPIPCLSLRFQQQLSGVVLYVIGELLGVHFLSFLLGPEPWLGWSGVLALMFENILCRSVYQEVTLGPLIIQFVLAAY